DLHGCFRTKGFAPALDVRLIELTTAKALARAALVEFSSLMSGQRPPPWDAPGTATELVRGGGRRPAHQNLPRPDGGQRVAQETPCRQILSLFARSWRNSLPRANSPGNALTRLARGGVMQLRTGYSAAVEIA